MLFATRLSNFRGHEAILVLNDQCIHYYNIIVYSYGIGTIGALGHNDYEDKEYPTVFHCAFIEI